MFPLLLFLWKKSNQKTTATLLATALPRLAEDPKLAYAQTTDLLIARLRRSALRCAAKGRIFSNAFGWYFRLMLTLTRVLPGL